MRAGARVAAIALALGGCMPLPAVAPRSSVDAHYLARRRAATPVASTRVYRAAAATLSSRCQMWPNDSAYFDGAVARCGAPHALAASLARLFLERAANPRFLEPVMVDGQLRWVDPVEDLSCR